MKSANPAVIAQPSMLQRSTSLFQAKGIEIDSQALSWHVHAGKSVIIPQWAWDHCLRGSSNSKPVAVLVPRRAIAEGLSKFVAGQRNTVVGGEVGIGIGGAARFSGESMIVFMTYGFFRAISTGKSPSSWSGFPFHSIAHICSLLKRP